jgi:hypothetical protein
MLLNRIERNNKIKSIYESSNILASTYVPNDKKLTIIFKNGTSYTYDNVDKTDFFRFETAESQGNIFSKYIKNKSYVKNDDVDTENIQTEINETKEEEILVFEKGIIKFMNDIIDSYNTNNTINDKSLDLLSSMNVKLKEMKSL